MEVCRQYHTRGQQDIQDQTGGQGPEGFAGIKGQKRERGVNGLRGPPGPTTGGVVYTKWGRTTCPNTTGTQLLYAGRAAGSHYTQRRGGAKYLCLTEQPWYSTQWRIQGGSLGSYKLPLRLFYE